MAQQDAKSEEGMSVESSANQMPILVSINGTRERAHLRYKSEYPEIAFESSAFKVADIEAETADVNSEIIMDSTGRSYLRKTNGSVTIKLQPLVHVERNYISRIGSIEPLYPPSTEGWLTRISRLGRKSILFVHEIVNQPNLWLSIIDKTSFKIYESHQIKPFELGILKFGEEYDDYLKVFNSIKNQLDAERWIDDILSQAPPTWSELARIIENVYVPKLSLGNNAREVMEQLIPNEYGQLVRVQIMAFLALVTKWKIPAEDPVVFFGRLRPLRVLDGLLTGYVRSILAMEKPPPYVQIIQESAQHRLGRPARPLMEMHEADPWHLAYHRISEHLPKTVSTSMRYAAELNISKKILVELPVTREDAAKSKKMWSDRFSLMADGFRIRSYARPAAIGLVRLMDITRAHQWPHHHMKWSAAIEVDSYKHPQIQLMEMPPSAAERVLKVRPNTVEVEWSANIINANLYNDRSNEWKISATRLIKSMEGSRSLRRLSNEFGAWKGKSMNPPEPLWTKCLDATANFGYLADFEQSDYLEYLGLSREDLLQTLKDLRARAIIDVAYMPHLQNLMTIVITAQGSSSRICSLARGFLKHTPSALALLGRDSSKLVVLSRLPPSIAHQLMATLPTEGGQRGIALTCQRAASFRSYTWGFYQRLLREDGSWDEDVSAMLSQIRVPYQKDVQEHN